MTDRSIIEIQPAESGTGWTWNIKGTTLFHFFEDAEAAEQGALDDLGAAAVEGFAYPDQGDIVYSVPGRPPKPNLAVQEKRIWDAGRRIYALPAGFRLNRPDTIRSLRDILDNALTSNIVYGDFQMAEGYLLTLVSRLEATERQP
jgi:hypothetical protein